MRDSIIGGLQTALYMANRLKVYLKHFAQLPSSTAATNFRDAMVEFYAAILEFLARAIESLQKSTAARTFDAVWNPNGFKEFETKCCRIEQRTEAEATSAIANST